MAASSHFEYTHITLPFKLPEDFDPSGTHIELCDEPNMGRLVPREGFEYTVIAKESGRFTEKFHIGHDTPQKMEEELRKIPKCEIVFISLKLNFKGISNVSSKYYIGAMMESWGAFKISQASSSSSDDVTVKFSQDQTTTIFEFDGYKLFATELPNTNQTRFIVTQGELMGIIFTHTERQIEVVGYDAFQEVFPKEFYRILYLHYPTIKVEKRLVPYEFGTSTLYHTRYIDPDVKIITNDIVKGVVYREDGNDRIVLGMGPDLELLERNVALELILKFGFIVPDEKVKKSYLEITPSHGGNCTVTGGPLCGLILRKDGQFYYPTVPTCSKIIVENSELIRNKYRMIVPVI